MIATQVTKYDEFLAKVKDHTAACVPKTGDEFDVCFSRALSEDVIKMEDKYTEVTRYRDSMSSRLRNYTCEDPTMVTSKPIQSLVMNVQNKNYNVDVLFDNPSAKIWIVHDFISDEECQILEDHGLPRLTRATVAGDDGRSIVSENRKAQQASYNMHQTHEHDPLRSLNERVLRITNERTGYKLRAGGQEDLTIIQYNKDDQYTPHCDGSCDGTLHKTGGRVATAVMYCRTATLGGGTTFSKADIFVKPTNGMATFFSYRGLAGRMEDGFTEHSGCPVLEGEKWITTQWMREGVTEADTWVNFDPSGVRSSEYETDTGAASEDVSK